MIHVAIVEDEKVYLRQLQKYCGSGCHYGRKK